MTSPAADRDPFEVVAESFLARYRAGERPSVHDYAARHPELADQIRRLLPALVMVEQDLSIDPDLDPPARPGSTRSIAGGPGQLGDYRIVREVGRGGMGIVYEAEQVSLGRRVALKVLPRHMAGSALERFRREAKAAARLHHTNIVPVFEVGRHGDVSYYAMQFIQGQGLDQVIDELARLREPGRKAPARDPAATESAEPPATSAGDRVAMSSGPREREFGRVAERLLSGTLAIGAMESASIDAHTAIDPEQTEPVDLDANSDHARVAMRGGHPTARRGPDPPSSAVLPGGTPISDIDASGRMRAFFRSVAQIGRQSAQGLAYAHARGIVHRDIKPSNLLLDMAGVVWITDFGLAKGEDEGLTETGDILGTLRYMAPERFRGEGDARADVYALGLTLYELLTLRPAFDTSDRLKLIERIKAEEPARPRSLDARIPRDLETIVLKASDKDPALRYATAEAMAEDLRRFLSDEPIQARRIGGAERAWRWCRRNPGMASASALSILALVATSAIALAFAVHEARNAHQQTLAAGRELGLRKNSEVLLAQRRPQGGREPVRAERGRTRPALVGPGPGICPGGPAGPATGDPPEHRSLESLGPAIAPCSGVFPECDRRGHQPRRDPGARRQRRRDGAALGAGVRPPDRTAAAARRSGAGRRFQPRWKHGRHRRHGLAGTALEVGHRP